MSEKAKKELEMITEKLSQLPSKEAEAALNQYASRMEGYAEGFAAGQAYAKKEAVE